MHMIVALMFFKEGEMKENSHKGYTLFLNFLNCETGFTWHNFWWSSRASPLQKTLMMEKSDNLLLQALMGFKNWIDTNCPANSQASVVCKHHPCSLRFCHIGSHNILLLQNLMRIAQGHAWSWLHREPEKEDADDKCSPWHPQCHAVVHSLRTTEWRRLPGIL